MVDRRRHGEVRIGQPGHDSTGCEIRSKRNHCDSVQLILDDVQRLAGEQDPVAVRNTLGAERELTGPPSRRIDAEELARVGLDGDATKSAATIENARIMKNPLFACSLSLAYGQPVPLDRA